MKLSGFVTPTLLLIGLSLSATVSARLIDRGNGLIYDDSLNVLWLSDANLAGTMAVGNPLVATYSLVGSGLMQSNGIAKWLNYLNSSSYGGVSGWRLPTAGNCATLTPCYTGELGHLFHVDLGLNAGTRFASSTSPNLGLFNVPVTAPGGNTANFWIGDAATAGVGSTPYFSNGFETNNEHSTFAFYVWAVRSGDIAIRPPSVPIPAAGWLLGSALLGCAALRRNQKRS